MIFDALFQQLAELTRLDAPVGFEEPVLRYVAFWSAFAAVLLLVGAFRGWLAS